jgi:hypothetical protein
MPKPVYKVGIITIMLVGIGVGVFLLFTIFPNAIREQLTGETPQAKIAAYLQAILQHDKRAALDLWEPQAPDPERYDALRQRREKITDELLAVGMTDFTVLEPEWWTTCCEPQVTCESRNAGGARIQVQILDDEGMPLLYTFDVFAREQPYWGDAMGNPPRHWVIRDVYALDQEPLFWRLVYEPHIQFLEENTNHILEGLR